MLAHFLLLTLAVRSRSSNIPLGVAPEQQALYIPSTESLTWKCLDGSQEIPWGAVNDDYCDCPDGSDEPGTSACLDNTFYCINDGHIGTRIPSSRVGDGKCEQDCCDGSDERPGLCPNICKEVGEAYRKKVDAERKLRKTGSKIRATYLTFALKEKKRLEESVVLLEREIIAREKDVARLRDVMLRTESLSAAALDFKKQSPLYQSLLSHNRALRSLRTAYLNRVEKERQLGEILEALKKGYNPNYQDMAVLEAVRGWEALSGKKNEEPVEGESTDEQVEEPVPDEESDWTEEQLELELDDISAQDHVSLLLGHESHTTKEPSSLLFDISSYIPDALAPQYAFLRTSAHWWLRTLGITRGDGTNSDEASQARTAFNEAEKKLNAVKERKRDDQEELAELFDPEGFGPEGEWKKLQGLCLSKDTGEYIYEVCLFGDATQKPSGGGTHHNLGKFSSWNTDPNVKPGEPRYYEVQHYTRGAKCWNGPERSVTLHLTCGTENQLLTVAEPEKCEYHLTGTTPALCIPLEVAESKRQEL